jgi:hypothetical protein
MRTISQSKEMTMARRFYRTALAWGIAAMMLGGCAQSTQDIRIRVTPRTVTVDQPPFVATGDRVRVQVIDSTFANRYVARDSAGTLIGMDRAPLFGETDLKTISVGFPISRVLPSDAAADANKGLTPSFVHGGKLSAPAPRSDATARLAELSAAVTEMNLRAKRMALRLDTLRDRVRADPAERARLGLLSDLSWVPAARTVADDPTPARLQGLIETLGSARPAGYIFPDSFYSVRQEAERYGRRVDALRLVMPVEQLAGLADTSSVPQLLVNLAGDVAAYDATQPRRERAERALGAMVLTPAEQAVLKAIPPVVPRPRQFLVLGMDLTSILASGDTLQARIDEVRNVVADVNRSTSRVAGAMTLLPRWTKNPDPDTVITRVYPSESDVRIVVLRRDRFAPWTATPGASPAAPKPADAQTTQTSTASATTVTTVTTITPAGSGDSKSGDSNKTQTATPPATSFTTLTPPAGNDTVAVLSIPVIQRYRFHLGVGMVYSFLKTTAFETKADTVEGAPGVRVLRVGTDEDRLLPVAILSYTLFPLEGRFADRRARRYPWNHPSLQIQGGLALQNPTEQLYAGIAAEFFPGLETGVGYNWAYVETSTRENGEFVPFSAGAATSKRWRRGKAVSVTLDATTFVKAFGGLLGL